MVLQFQIIVHTGRNEDDKVVIFDVDFSFGQISADPPQFLATLRISKEQGVIELLGPGYPSVSHRATGPRIPQRKS